MNWHNKNIEETVNLLDVTLRDGLSSKEAAKRLKQYGSNELVGKKNKNMALEGGDDFFNR